MKTLITRIKRLALALCFVTPLVSWAAVDYTDTDYEPWSYSAGCVVWRAASAQVFHVSTVADVAAGGTIGETYALGSSDHPWQVFASNQTAYSAPGKTLVFDEAGYNTESDAQFAPLSLGGMWVKALQAENTPYCITDNKTDSTDRKVELGAANASTYFKFDESFTFDRNSATKVIGTATVEIATDKTFTINARANKGAVVESGNTLVLKGEGTLAVVAGLTVAAGGTLDLSAATRPAIDGDVTLSAGSTIVLPAGTDVSETPFTVCSGTLTSGGVINVKVGSADAEKALVTVGNGAITAIATTVTYTATIDGDTAFSAIEWTVGGEAATITSMDIAVLEISGTGVVTGLTEAPAKVTLASGVTLDVTELSAEAFAGIEKSTAGTYRWTSGFPITVPQGWTYEYVGGSTEAGTVNISEGMLNDQGNLKTSGYLSIDNFWMGWTTASLDILDGKTTIGANTNEKALRGTVTIREDAELVNTRVSDALAYDASAVVNVYGTLSMGATRWSLGSNNTLNFYEGCTVTGSGQSSNGTFDWIENATANLNVTGPVTIDAPIRIREGATVNVTVDSGANDGLALGTTIGIGKIVKKGAGLIKFTTNPSYAITCQNGAFTFGVNATPTITYTAKPSNSTSMWYAQQSTWRGTVVIGNLNAPAALPLNTWGNENSKIVLTGTTGSCHLNGTTTVAAELVVGTNENSVVEFNNGNSGQVGTFSKVSGPGTLKLVAWGGCSAATYVLNTLNNFDGLAVANNITRGGGGTFTVRIGNILTTSSTDPGDCVLPIVNTAAENATGTVVYDLANAQVNGNTLDLEAKSDGIYVVVPVTTVDITIPEVDNATVSVTADGVAVTPENGVVTVDIGAAVVVTYTSTTHEVTNGTIEFTASEAYTVDVSGVTTTPYVASIVDGASYTSLQAAFDAATNGKKIVLLANEEAGVTLPSEEKMVYFYAGELTHGEIANATGNYITTVTENEVIKIGSENVTATKYRVQAGWAVVTIGGTATMYAMADYAIAFEAANAGGVGTTVKFLDGQGASHAEYLPAFTYDSVNDIYVLEETPVAAVYSGVSQLGTYTSIDDAIAAVDTDGLTVKLLADVDVVSTGLTFPADKTITFDLNGYTLTAGNGATSHVQVNGVVTITDSSEGAEGQIVSGENGTYGLVQVAENNTQEGAALTIAGGTIEAYFPDTLNGSQQHPAYGVTVKGKGTVFNMTGGKVKAGLMAVMGHGNKASAGTYTISGGTIESVDDFAMYLPTKGGCSVTISGGTFVGKGGICVRAGTLNVTGGTFTASGTGIAPGASAGTTGASFAGLSVWPNYGVIDVTISGGAFTSATGVDAVVSTESDYTASISLTGGAYSTDPSAYVAFGYKATETAGIWTVAQQPTTPPETPQVIDVDTTKEPEQQQADADAIAQDTVVTTPNADVAAAVSAETYDSYFTKTAVKVNEQWTVQTALNEDVVFPTEESDDLTADLAGVLDVAAGADVEITTAKPGLYYSIEAAENVGFTSGKVEGARELATTTTVSPTKPTVTGTPTAVFFRVKVSTTQE